MRSMLIGFAILWAIGSAAVPALEGWNLGSIDTMGSDQIERIQE